MARLSDAGLPHGAALQLGPMPPGAAGPAVLVPPSHVLRRGSEICIREVYRRAFDAEISEFPFNLCAVVDADGTPLCAAGIRTLADGFFSEAYLDGPVESLLSAQLGRPVRREAIFEVTTLASRRVESSPAFLRGIADMGRDAGFEWSLFTATRRLRRLLKALGFQLCELGDARPERVADPERWGSYYDHSPKVCVASGPWGGLGAIGGMGWADA